MMSKKSFETVAFTLATLRFNEWCKELNKTVFDAFNSAVNIDNRLSFKTKDKIYQNFVQEVKNRSPKVV